MGLPMFGADSRLDQDTLTVSPAAAAGFPASNLQDDRAFTVFKPSSSATLDIKTDAGVGNTVDVDYFGLIFHDLSTQSAVLTFASSPDDIVYTTIFTITPSDNLIILRTFTKVTRRFFRLRITGAAAAPSIGELQWGVRVSPPQAGVQRNFDPLAEGARVRSTRSQEGNILGSIQQFVERRASIILALQPNSFVNDATLGGFRDFWDNHAVLGKPFFWAWNPGNPGNFEKDSFFAVVPNDVSIRRPLATPLDAGFRDITFDVLGLKE